MRRNRAVSLGLALGFMATTALAGGSPVVRRMSRTDLLRAPADVSGVQAPASSDPTRSGAGREMQDRVRDDFEMVGPADASLNRGSLFMEGFQAPAVKAGLDGLRPSIRFERVAITDEDLAAMAQDKTPVRAPYVERVQLDSSRIQ